MRLVAGLGNPGREYDGTRHNIGFDIVDVLASHIGATPWKAWKKGLVAKGKLGGEDLVLLKPQTYMNLSGDSVSPALAFYKLPPEHLIVVHDALPQTLELQDAPESSMNTSHPRSHQPDRLDRGLGRLLSLTARPAPRNSAYFFSFIPHCYLARLNKHAHP